MSISEVRNALVYAYNGSGYAHRLQDEARLDDDICRMLRATGTDDKGRVNTAMLSKISTIPEWRDRFIETFNAKFSCAANTTHLGYPAQLHRSNFHDGQPGSTNLVGVPESKHWVCGPGGSLGYGGK